MSNNKIKSFWDEEWMDLIFDNLSERSVYKISNYGRIISYYFHKDGALVNSFGPNGYKTFVIRDKSGKVIHRYVHRLVAEYFLEKPKEDQTQVIHIDNVKGNNYYKNLSWASEKEKRAHQDTSMPGWSGSGVKGFRAYTKLTETQVKLIKRKINDPNRKTRMKIIAKRYGVSVMQLYRIKSGENWGSVTPD